MAEFEARMFRHEDLLESGDIDGARIEARAMRRLGESTESSGILAMAFSMQATHTTADGPLADARQALRDSREHDAKQGESSNSQNRLGSQLLLLRWHEGRIGEMEAGYRRAIDVFPQMSNVRSALAFIYAETGQLEKARIEFSKLTEQPVASIPKDYSWWFTSAFLSYVAIALGEAAVARGLYELLRPYAHRNASTAGAVSFGSAELVLALLAEFLGDERAAREHFELALAFNIRTRQRVWIARTRFHYAKMLLAHGAADDVPRAHELARIARADAQEIGMTALVEQIHALTGTSDE